MTGELPKQVASRIVRGDFRQRLEWHGMVRDYQVRLPIDGLLHTWWCQSQTSLNSFDFATSIAQEQSRIVPRLAERQRRLRIHPVDNLRNGYHP